MTDFKIGDEVIARHKTDPQTVIHGRVRGCWSGDHLVVQVGQSTPNHTIFFENYDIEKVKPPIRFGIGALIRIPEGGIVTRDEWGHWWYIGKVGLGHTHMSSSSDSYWINQVSKYPSRYDIFHYGIDVEADSSWPEVTR